MKLFIYIHVTYLFGTIAINYIPIVLLFLISLFHKKFQFNNNNNNKLAVQIQAENHIYRLDYCKLVFFIIILFYIIYIFYYHRSTHEKACSVYCNV